MKTQSSALISIEHTHKISWNWRILRYHVPLQSSKGKENCTKNVAILVILKSRKGQQMPNRFPPSPTRGVGSNKLGPKVSGAFFRREEISFQSQENPPVRTFLIPANLRFGKRKSLKLWPRKASRSLEQGCLIFRTGFEPSQISCIHISLPK